MHGSSQSAHASAIITIINFNLIFIASLCKQWLIIKKPIILYIRANFFPMYTVHVCIDKKYISVICRNKNFKSSAREYGSLTTPFGIITMYSLRRTRINLFLTITKVSWFVDCMRVIVISDRCQKANVCQNNPMDLSRIIFD